MKKITKQKQYLLMLVLILLLGAFFRILNLAKFDLWYDEALSLLQANHIERVIFLHDINPPLYLVFLHFWSKCFDSEFGLRLASVIFGLISIWMIFILGKILFTKKTGLISAFLLAISPIHIYYSQDLRMYSLVALLNLICVYFLMQCVRKARIRFWVGFVVANVLNIYCHYIGVLSWMAQVIFLLLYRRKLDSHVKRRWLVGNALIFLSFAPWFYFLIKAMGAVEKNLLNLRLTPWGPPVSFTSLFMAFKNFTAGYHSSLITYLPLMAIFFYFFIKGALKLRPRKELILCLLYLLIPISIAYFASPLKRFFIDRFFIGSFLFYILIVAGQLSYLGKKALFAVLFIIGLLTVFPLLNHYRNILPLNPQGRPWVLRKTNHEDVSKYIFKRFRRGDYVMHTCPVTVFPFIYYFGRHSSEVNLLTGTNFLVILPNDSNKPVAREFSINFGSSDRFLQFPLEDKDRFWLIFSYWDFDRIETDDPRALSILSWIDKNYTVVKKSKFDGTIVFLYEKR